MSTHQYREELAFPFKRADCFYCNKAVDLIDRFVEWHGSTGANELMDQNILFLHPNCAIVLSAHLTKDALTYAK